MDAATTDAADAASGDAREARAPGTFPDYESGTRLRAEVVQTANGDKLWVGWHDSARDEGCRFGVADDGQLRCLPASLGGVDYFADTDCKQPLDQTTSGGWPYLFDWGAGNLCSRMVIYKKDAPATVTKAYRRAIGGNCYEATIYPSQTFSTTVQVPASAFVAASEVRDTRGALEVLYYEAEDGALQTVSPYDPAAAQACGPFGAEVPDRCVPTATPRISKSTQNWSDNKCTTPILDDYKGCGAYYYPPQGLVATYDDTVAPACDGTVALTFYRLGAEAPPGGLYQFSGTTCQSYSRSPQTTYFSYGAKFDLTTLPALTRVDVGQGRIKVRYLATSASAKLQASSLFDSTLTTTCSATSLGGSLRCVPDGPYSSLFTDDKCMTPVFTRAAQASCSASAAPPFVKTYTDATHLYTVGAKLTGVTSLHTNEFGGCSPAIDDPTTLDVFGLTESAATDFATVTDVVE
jgi:hypothetical protein